MLFVLPQPCSPIHYSFALGEQQGAEAVGEIHTSIEMLLRADFRYWLSSITIVDDGVDVENLLRGVELAPFIT